MNPYALLGAGLLAVLLAVGGFRFGVKYQQGQEARAAQLITETREQARLGAAEAIAQLKPRNTIIKQQLETVTREVEVYRECRNTDIAMGLLNDALAGGRPEPAGGGKLPAVDAADR